MKAVSQLLAAPPKTPRDEALRKRSEGKDEEKATGRSELAD